MSGLIPPCERSCAEPAKARPNARASVINLFILSCENGLGRGTWPSRRINSFFDCKGSATRAQYQEKTQKTRNYEKQEITDYTNLTNGIRLPIFYELHELASAL